MNQLPDESAFVLRTGASTAALEQQDGA
jgi:hypothetical protein